MFQNNATDIYIFQAIAKWPESKLGRESIFLHCFGTKNKYINPLRANFPIHFNAFQYSAVFSLGLGTNALIHLVPMFHLF